MCFRPAEMDTGGPVICAQCGKKINRVAGEIPSKCPFCKAPTAEMIADAPDAFPPSPPTAPAPAEFGAMAGGTPKPPTAP